MRSITLNFTFDIDRCSLFFQGRVLTGRVEKQLFLEVLTIKPHLSYGGKNIS